MSGALSTFGLGSSASLLSRVPGVGNLAAGALSRLLTTAALGGVVFDALDSRELAGRRIVRVLFPDRASSEQVFQDFGNFEGPIRITGFLSGDDYVVRAERMRKVLLKPGSTTLVHPWWGRLRVRLLEPGEIGFSSGQIRLAHFQCVVVRDPGPPGKRSLFQSITDTLSNLLEKGDAMLDEVTLAAQAVLSPLAIPLALATGVSSMVSQAEGVWTAVIGNAPEPVQTAASPGIANLTKGISAPVSNTDTTYADTVTDMFAAVPIAVVNAISDPETSVIAHVSPVITAASDTLDGQTVFTILLSASEKMGTATGTVAAVSAVPAPVLALGVCARAQIISQIFSAWAALTFTSGADAMAARDLAVAAIDALLVDIENAAASGAGVSLSGLWLATQAARTAIIADCSAQVGRLPEVVKVQVDAPVSGWALAYAIAGDAVGQVQAVFDDLVARNGVAHPGQIGPGSIEVLEQNS